MQGWKARQNRAGVPLVTIRSVPALCWKKSRSSGLPEKRLNSSCSEQTLSFYRVREENGIICSMVDFWNSLKTKKKPFFCFRIIMKFFCKYMKILHNNHRQKKIRIHRREGIEAMGLSSVLRLWKRWSYRYLCDTWWGQRMLFGVHATERNLFLQHVSGIWNAMLFLNKSYSWKGVWQQSSCHGLWKGIRSLRFYSKASSPFAKI